MHFGHSNSNSTEHKRHLCHTQSSQSAARTRLTDGGTEHDPEPDGQRAAHVEELLTGSAHGHGGEAAHDAGCVPDRGIEGVQKYQHLHGHREVLHVI